MPLCCCGREGVQVAPRSMAGPRVQLPIERGATWTPSRPQQQRGIVIQPAAPALNLNPLFSILLHLFCRLLNLPEYRLILRRALPA